MKRIDDAAYSAGRIAFGTGDSLRSLIEPMITRDAVSTVEQEERDVSRVLGFIDAAFDKLREKP